MNHEHPLCAHLFHYDPCSDANTSFFALSSNIPFLVYITLVPRYSYRRHPEATALLLNSNGNEKKPAIKRAFVECL